MNPSQIDQAVHLGLVWVAAWVGASALFRRSRGKAILFLGVKDADFIERTASGHSRRNLLTRIGGANRCLVVAVARGRIVIGPWFPFTLMFLPEIFALELDIPVSQVTSCEITKGRLRTKLTLGFHDQHRQPHEMSLYLKETEEFMKTIKAKGANLR